MPEAPRGSRQVVVPALQSSAYVVLGGLRPGAELREAKGAGAADETVTWTSGDRAGGVVRGEQRGGTAC
ncbi:hypothetical protein [Streptomyces phaeoluteigriseus]